MLRITGILTAVLALSAGPRMAIGQPCPDGPGCDGWSANFRAEGVAGPLQVVLTDDGQIYAYGRPMLGTAGPVWNGVLRWNGSDWDPIGGDFNAEVTGLHSLGPTVYALGGFSNVGSVSARHVAVWSGSKWRPLASGFDDLPLAFAVAPDGTIRMGGGTRTLRLHAPAVYSSTEGLKSWDGSAWSSQVHNSPTYIDQIVVAPDGTIYASLNESASVSGFCLARRSVNAAQFECIGQVGRVGSMAVDASGNLYVAGGIRPEGVPLQLWVDGQPQGSVLDSVREVYGRGGQIWALTSENDSLRIRHLVGSQWQVVGPAFTGTVNDISASPGQGVIVAGSIRRAGGGPNELLVHLVGADWNPIRDSTPRLGLQGRVRLIHALPEGGALMGEEFRDRTFGVALYVKMFKRGQWTTFGEAFDEEIHVLYGDQSSEIFVSGWFRHSGDTELDGLARWDGSEWRSMGALPVPAGPDAVKAFARDEDGRLVAVGVDSAGMGFVVRWNDPGWTVLATIEGAISSVVLASDGTMVVGGDFDTAGLRHIAQLVGSALVGMGGGFEGRASALVVHKGQVVALENTSSLSSGSTSQARRWSGSTWEAMDAGFTGGQNYARYLGVDEEGRLYAAGNFRWAGTANAHGFSRWGGRRWEPVPGLSGEIGRLGEYIGVAPEFWSPGSPVLAVAPSGTLYIGIASDLAYAGGTVASRFMVWSPNGPPAEAGPPGLPATRYSVYPNPTTGMVRIAGGPAPTRVSVFDALGRLFGTIELGTGDSEVELQLPVTARGVYFLVLDFDGSRQTVPVIVR